jgi:signal transduction histidine kinase
MAHPNRVGVSEVVSAVACGILSLSGALILPPFAAAEEKESIPSISPSDAAWWVLVAALLFQAITLVWAKRSPRMVLFTVATVGVVYTIAVPEAVPSLTAIAVSFGTFWAVLREPLKRLTRLLPLVALFVAGPHSLSNIRTSAPFDFATSATAVLQAVAIVGLPVVAALFFVARRDARDSRAKEFAALQRERQALVQAAVARERIGMSRELHDIAAHHMSGIAILASAMYQLVDIDPEAAKTSAQQVRAQSMTVLDDLRGVIGLLRDEAETIRSVETLDAVRTLVEGRRAAGMEIDFELLTSERTLGTGIGPLSQFVAYRMVQESLANVSAHAAGANCLVRLDDREPGQMTVLVQNDGSHAPDPGPGGGFGLLGMRERADLVGGEVHHGATKDGGWQVRLTLKRDMSIHDDSAEESA